MSRSARPTSRRNGTDNPAGLPCSVAVLLALAILAGLVLGHLAPLDKPWTLNDLRLLDASFTPDPASDLTAIYTRPSGLRCEIRLDFLELPPTPRYNLIITIKNRVTVIKNDLPLPERTRLTYDSDTAVMVLTLPDCAPEPPAALTVQTTSETLRTSYGTSTALQPLSLRWVFTNTFSPTATPAQTLRRWDGAHTGPRGERHGLRGLLAAAEKYQVPLTLFDVKSPPALSALEAAGGLAQLRLMERAGLLALPISGPDLARPGALAFARIVAGQFGLDPGAEAHLTLPPRPDSFRWPQAEPGQAGLPLEMRRELTRLVFSGTLPVLLGGDFQHSTWGTPEYARSALAWLSARPYFHFDLADDLDTIPVEQTSAPINPIARSALEFSTVLAQSDARLAENYAGLLPVLQAAADWSEHPAPQAVCRDLCILASDKFYAVLDPLGGRLVFLFAGTDQLVGPTAQFFLGLSDSSSWDLSQGLGADQAQIMGAFADAQDAFLPYQAGVSGPNSIRFVSKQGGEKIFRLVEDGLQVQLSASLQTQVPLVVAPQARFNQGWAGHYEQAVDAGSVVFGLTGGPLVRIKVSEGAACALESFVDVIPALVLPEDPDAENPPGFYWPFPLAVVRLSGPENVRVEIILKN